MKNIRKYLTLLLTGNGNTGIMKLIIKIIYILFFAERKWKNNGYKH